MSPTQPHLFWYRGRIFTDNKLEIETDNPALLYGASAFTTMRVYDRSLENRLTSWDAHYQRLSHTLDDLGWNQPDWQRVKQGFATLLSRYDIIRVAIFPDGRELISGRDLPDDLSPRQQQGITVLVLETHQYQRALPTYKTGNYLPCWLALNLARQISAQEAILVDSQGNWLETATGNLWGWRDSQWWTPSLSSGILPGIRRAQLLEWLNRHQLPVGENIWEPDFVAGLEALAYTNCAVEVVPIHTTISGEKEKAYQINKTALAQLTSFFAS